MNFIDSIADLVIGRSDLRSIAEQQIHEMQKSILLLGAKALIDFEVQGLCGRIRERNPRRECVRYGSQTAGHITLLDQKVPFRKPRVRTKEGNREVELPMYNKFQTGMSEDAFRKMLFGVSTRNYELVIHAIQDGYGIAHSSVSRHFVKETSAAIESLCERPIDRYYPVLYIDGFAVGGEMMLVSLGIDMAGHKIVLSMRQGTTESAEVVKSMFDELENRGLSKDKPILFVIDGSKAIHKAIKDRFPLNFIQRCQVHKERNVLGHIEKHKRYDEFHARLSEAYAQTDFNVAKDRILEIAKDLENVNGDAASSMREGLDDTLTVMRLNAAPLLARSLRSTNPIESLNSMLETFSVRVKYWRGGSMRKRWLAAAAIESEKRMRRVRGYLALPQLIERMCKLASVDMQKVVGEAA
jgi:transposase-like protein